MASVPLPVRAACAAVVLSCVFSSRPVFATDEPADEPLSQVVISASRAIGGVPRALLDASVTVLEAADLRERQVRFVADVLRDVPGVSVSQAGPAGSVTQVRLRGSESNHTLVLIDGMQASDPYFGEFDFGTLMADSVARVEVLRGQQSALYGSDAIGGVIHYITLSGREAPGLSGHIETGSFGTLGAAARVAGVSDALDYAFSAGRYNSAGSPSARFGSRNLAVDNNNLSARLQWAGSEAWRVRAVLRYARSQVDFNQQDFDDTSPTYGYVIDTTDRSDTRSVQGLLALETQALQGRWQQSLTVQALDAQRASYVLDQRDTGSTGGRLKASSVSSLAWGATRWAQQLVLAIDAQREQFQNTTPGADAQQGASHHLDNLGVVGQYSLRLGDAGSLSASLRHDDNQRFASVTTYRVQAGTVLPGGLRLHAAAGSGIKNPTPTELFGYDPHTFIGNSALKPEQSRGWELGLEQQAFDQRLRMALTWAQSVLREEIYTVYNPDFVASSANRTSLSHQRDLELAVSARLFAQWHTDVSYTWLDAREQQLHEVRRPPHIGSLNLVWDAPGDRGGVHVGWRYNGSTDDYNFTASGPPRVRLSAYKLLQIGARWRLANKLQLQARVENALAQRYEDVYTYRMPGRAFYVGLSSAP